MSDQQESAAEIIIEAWRQGRPIIPFLGAGVSQAAGFPAISRLTAYLAKVQFALDKALYSPRYPMVMDGLETAIERYKRRPSEFIADFGWPEIGQLNADIWEWIVSPENGSKRGRGRLITTPDDVVQEILRQRLERSEPRISAVIRSRSNAGHLALAGDWAAMLDHLSEGQLGLIDSLFAGLDHGRSPTRAHIFLTFLVRLMGIPLVLSLNFDTLLETAMEREGLRPRLFDVHRDADLPHVHLVRQQFSFVKLHGSAYGLRFGERLQYSLESEAREKICAYVPNHALLVVIGFSGWERRMTQVIGELARRKVANTGTVQVLWLTTEPYKDSDLSFLALQKQELDNQGLKGALVPMVICDANSFLAGLFFRVASCFPAARERYDCLVSRPITPRSKSHDALNDISLPAVVVMCEGNPRTLLRNDNDAARPSSWATMAASEFTARHRDRDVIWVDLESHQTVEAVVRDILGQIRRVDPDAPMLVLPTEVPGGGDKSELVKPVERIREACQRGRYMIVFDSMESFGRPQMVHHGLPRWEGGSEYERRFLARVQRLCDFVCLLVGTVKSGGDRIEPPLYDTSIVLTVTHPSGRHAEPGKERNQFVGEIRHTLAELLITRLSGKAVHSVSQRGAPSIT